MIFRPIACSIWSGSRISGQKAILEPEKIELKNSEQTLGVKTTCRVTSSKSSENENTKITKFDDIWSHRMF